MGGAPVVSRVTLRRFPPSVSVYAKVLFLAFTLGEQDREQTGGGLG